MTPGSGKDALEAQARVDEARRLVKEERERALLDERQRAEAVAPLERLSWLINELVKAALEARGFKRHARGEWRLARR